MAGTASNDLKWLASLKYNALKQEITIEDG